MTSSRDVTVPVLPRSQFGLARAMLWPRVMLDRISLALAAESSVLCRHPAAAGCARAMVERCRQPPGVRGERAGAG